MAKWSQKIIVSVLLIKTKEDKTADSVLTSWQNLSMAHRVSMFPLRSHSQREKVKLLHSGLPSTAVGTPAPTHATGLGTSAHNGSYPQWLLPKHTQTHQDVSLFRQAFTLPITSWGDASLCIVKIGGRSYSPLNSLINGSLGDIWFSFYC